MMGHGPMMHGFGGFAGFRDLQVAIPLADGPWLSFATALPHGGPAFSSQFLVSMAVMAIIILAVSVWAVRRVTAPLASLATAAERLGHDVNAPPLPEVGTTETRQAARAFNDMQTRLRNLIENRTRLLAAISHDLRTPLTLLRLRAETVENAQERDKMLSTIAEMDSMIGATLQFARDESASEPQRQTDLTSLLQSVVDDMRDAGLPVRMEPAGPIIYECQPAALKRAVRNLLDNAVKYGKAGSVGIRTTAADDRDRYRRRRPGNSRAGALTRARAVLPPRGIAQPRDRRGWPGPGDHAVDRAGSRWHAQAEQSTDWWLARQHRASPVIAPHAARWPPNETAFL